jgi:hypothetical protein
VWLALAGPGGTRTKQSQFRGDRGQVRMLASYGALQLVREALGAPPLPRHFWEVGQGASPGKA